MLQVLSEILLSILCVYGGYRLLHDFVNLLERRLGKRRDDRPDRPDGMRHEDEMSMKGGEDSESKGSQ